MVTVARGEAQVIAYKALFLHGHHDNLGLIDRAVHQSHYDLAIVHSESSIAIAKAGAECRAALQAEAASRR